MKVYILKQTDSNYMQEMKETVGIVGETRCKK